MKDTNKGPSARELVNQTREVAAYRRVAYRFYLEEFLAQLPEAASIVHRDLREATRQTLLRNGMIGADGRAIVAPAGIQDTEGRIGADAAAVVLTRQVGGDQAAS